jgi:O-antigen ligase
VEMSGGAETTRLPSGWQTNLLVGSCALVALAFGAVLGRAQDPYLYVVALGGVVVICLFVFRQNDLLGAMIVATAIVIDSYQLVQLPLRFTAVATVIAGLAVLTCYFYQSPKRPWTNTPYLWIWSLILLLAAIEIPFSVSLSNALRYFITVLVNMPLAYMLGVQIGQDMTRVRRLVIALAVLAALISVHAIIQAQLRTFLFFVPVWSSVLASNSNYVLSGTDKIRAGSFFINPDKLGVYLGVMLPVLLGLGVALKSPWARLAAFVGAGQVALGLLLTYSTASFIATGAGLLAAFLLVARGWARLYLPAIVLALAVALGTLFPASVQALQGHATAAGEVSERVGAWQTGITTIAHNPLTGVGLGYTNYVLRTNDLYRSPLETVPVDDPQNSFLELAAMGGVAVALLYMLVLGLCSFRAWKNYVRARDDERVLIGAVLVSLIVLTVNSFATPGWTFPALGVLGWLLLGAIASPSLLLSAGRQTSSFPDRAEILETAELAPAMAASREDGA